MKTLIPALILLTAIVSNPTFASDNMIVASADTSKYATFLAPVAKGKGVKQGMNNQKRVDQATMAMTVKQELTQVHENELTNVLESLKLEQASYLNAFLESSLSQTSY